MPQTKNEKIVTRPPVVVIMGHVDHGKSTLLDYIRKTNVTGGEAGGITQAISAYEVSHVLPETKEVRKITFLDTPGHEAFSKMRARGAVASDIAILIVSAEDSVKAQTLEAYNTIIESNTPYIVAINKIDKPNANVDKVKNDLVEKGIYLEGMGGDIPFVLISAKTGSGVDELLDMILLVADINNFQANTEANARGIVIEVNREPKRGIRASCIILDGTLRSGMFVACGKAIVTTRILENFMGKPIKEATVSSPILLVGFESLPEIGSEFVSFNTKKEAEKYIEENADASFSRTGFRGHEVPKTCKVIPLIIKTDVMGTIEAIEKQVESMADESICFKIISASTGLINENDIKTASIDKESIIVGFNTKIDNEARNSNEQHKVTVEIFDVIYKLVDYLQEVLVTRKPKQEKIEVTGTLKILRTFSATKDRQVVGGKVLTGKITDNGHVRIMRRDFEIGTGRIVGLQTNKIKAKDVQEGNECGVQIESKIAIAPNDVLEAYITTIA